MSVVLLRDFTMFKQDSETVTQAPAPYDRDISINVFALLSWSYSTRMTGLGLRSRLYASIPC
jgi:hypothetical protein